MLAQLSIRNFAIVKKLDIDFQSGMTTITGETGAGKSIAIDALGLCIGDRAESSMVREGADKAEITAIFELKQGHPALCWLKEQSMDAGEECIVRRVISQEGRSRAFINGTPVSLQQLKSLGTMILNIHGQHAHQALLNKQRQQDLLDKRLSDTSLLKQVAAEFKQLQALRKEAIALAQSEQERNARLQLLEYQVSELDEFALGEDEFVQLESDHKKLSHGQTLADDSQYVYDLLFQKDNAIQQQLGECVRVIEQLLQHDPKLKDVLNLLHESSIQIQEASTDLGHYVENLEVDPEHLNWLEDRFSTAVQLARKHQVAPEDLYQCHMSLTEELTLLKNSSDRVGDIEAEIELAQKSYTEAAQKLHKARKKQAKAMASDIQASVRELNMPNAVIDIEVSHTLKQPSEHGLDEIAFKVAINPGQDLQSMEKVVSGGELSRIGLAVQVLDGVSNISPTLIFDEVDTGISGATASVVGRMLRKLGQQAQVLCVTHLPQVAAASHNQMFVNKFTDGKTTETSMLPLDNNERLKELARLLGSETITDKSLANAEELLQSY